MSMRIQETMTGVANIPSSAMWSVREAEEKTARSLPIKQKAMLMTLRNTLRKNTSGDVASRIDSIRNGERPMTATSRARDNVCLGLRAKPPLWRSNSVRLLSHPCPTKYDHKLLKVTDVVVPQRHTRQAGSLGLRGLWPPHHLLWPCASALADTFRLTTVCF